VWFSLNAVKVLQLPSLARALVHVCAALCPLPPPRATDESVVMPRAMSPLAARIRAAAPRARPLIAVNASRHQPSTARLRRSPHSRVPKLAGAPPDTVRAQRPQHSAQALAGGHEVVLAEA